MSLIQLIPKLSRFKQGCKLGTTSKVAQLDLEVSNGTLKWYNWKYVFSET